jgi:hypothetical protein
MSSASFCRAEKPYSLLLYVILTHVFIWRFPLRDLYGITTLLRLAGITKEAW